MGDIQRNWHSFFQIVDGGSAIPNLAIWPAKVLQSGHDSDTGRIGQIAIVVKHMNVSTNGPAAEALENTKRFGIEGVGVAYDPVEDVCDIRFKFIGPSREEIKIDKSF